jgi:hypothetical protein
MSADSMDYDDEVFSLVVVKDVFEHCIDPLSSIAESYRVLADGGQVLAMIPLDGDFMGIDDVATHPSFNFNNESHVWKATQDGVFRRLFDIGFTDIQFAVFSHVQLFGEERPFGDKVLVVSGKKDKNIIKVPIQYLIGNAYWAAFLTFACTGDCEYCIQHVCKDEFLEARKVYESNRLNGEEWVSFYNRLQKWHTQKLGIIGGEPTIHPDFFDIVNGIEGYYLTVTSNLSSANIAKFEERIKDKSNLRINTSFHPDLMSVEDFVQKVHLLRQQGFNVDQIAIVDHSGVDFRKYHTEFVTRGLTLTPQTFLGIKNGQLFPNPESTITTDYGETGINNQALYQEWFSCKKKESVLCQSKRFLVAPDGGMYRCHYHLYSGRGKLGDAKTFDFNTYTDYSLCKDLGYCNPCDFPHVKFRPITIDLPNLITACVGDKPEIVQQVVQAIQHHLSKGDDYANIFNVVSSTLIMSEDPYWELYNNKKLHEIINDFLCKGSIIDNEYASFITALERTLFVHLPAGVNVYRILNSEALVKYLGMSVDMHNAVFSNMAELQEEYGEDMILLFPLIAKILSTFGSDLPYNQFYTTEEKEEVQTNE